jgi:hypothetical protein
VGVVVIADLPHPHLLVLHDRRELPGGDGKRGPISCRHRECLMPGSRAWPQLWKVRQLMKLTVGLWDDQSVRAFKIRHKVRPSQPPLTSSDWSRVMSLTPDPHAMQAEELDEDPHDSQPRELAMISAVGQSRWGGP